MISNIKDGENGRIWEIGTTLHPRNNESYGTRTPIVKNNLPGGGGHIEMGIHDQRNLQHQVGL